MKTRLSVFVFARNEMVDGSKEYLKAEMLKEFTGNDTMYARRLYRTQADYDEERARLAQFERDRWTHANLTSVTERLRNFRFAYVADP